MCGLSNSSLRTASTIIARLATTRLIANSSTSRLALTHREDDHPEAIASRLAQYHQEAEPLKDYYRKQGKLRVINGSQPIDRVFKEILFKLRTALV